MISKPLSTLLVPIAAALLHPAVSLAGTELDALDVVDYHVHYFSPEVVAAIETSGFDFSDSDYQFAVGPDFYDLTTILQNNEAARVVLLSGGFNYRFADAEREREAVEGENDRLAAAVHEEPARLYGFCGLDPLEPWSLGEAARCVGPLRLHGVKLHLPVSGVDLTRDDHRSRTRRFLAYCAEADIPVLIHNATTPLSGRAYAGLFIDALLDRMEGLTLIFAHAGGDSSYGSFTVDFLGAFAEYFEGGANDRRRHEIYFELSAFLAEGRVPEDASLDALAQVVEAIGPDRFLFGSDYPMRSAKRYLDELRSRLDLDPEALAAIAHRDLLSERQERP